MKILNKLTIKHLKTNKRRTVVSIIGIILSTALMVGIGLLVSTLIDNSIRMTELENGTHHTYIDVKKDSYNIIKDNKKIKEYFYSSSLGFAYTQNDNTYKPYVEVLSIDNDYLNKLKIVEGVLPKNNKEIVISKHLIEGGSKYKIGDTIKLELGKRYLDDKEVFGEFRLDEKLKINTTREYKIVGIVERNLLEDYSNPGYNAYTVNDETDNLRVYVTYKNVKKTYKNTEEIAQQLGYIDIGKGKNKVYNEVEYNEMLLYMHGITTYDNLFTACASILSIVLSLISIACIIVIYNSFAISVMERKKQFGLFASIGTTRKQLRYTVFFEAFIVGTIGILLGILSAFLGIGILVMIINHLLPGVFGVELRLAVYSPYIIIPIIFMILTIIISAFIPAKLASKVSPIEAIRQNDDIKIKGKVKSPKWIRKIFGIEGDLAYKNMKRNKKKYRITIVSLFISIVLFVSFSSIVKYGIDSSYDFAGMSNYEYYVQLSDVSKDDIDEVEKNIKKYGYSDYISFTTTYLSTDKINNDMYSDELKKSSLYNNDYLDIDYGSLNIVSLDRVTYEKFKKQIGLDKDQPILLNSYETIVYGDASRKQVKLKPFNEVKELNFNVTLTRDLDYKNESEELNIVKPIKIEDIYYSDIVPNGLQTDYPLYSITLIVSEEYYSDIVKEYNGNNDRIVALCGSNYTELTKYLDGVDTVSVHAENIKEQMKLMYNILLVIKILLYGFITLVTLIGVTSVLNTINTSIALRRKEFAMLRSMGLTPHGFNKILFFESLFFGLKSLLYGIPVSLGITYLLHKSFNGIVEFDKVMIPWQSIIISIVGVFVIVLISMWYASRKIKKENILDAIREENI